MIEVRDGGFETTVQDYPGRLGYYGLGVPFSGPSDSPAFRLGNLTVGNPSGEAGLEIALFGPKLRFQRETVIAVTGADLSPTINQEPMPMWRAVGVKTGDILEFSLCRSGCRGYIMVAGGIDVPEVLGSKSTYLKGFLGGVDGRKLEQGDILKTGNPNLPLEKLRQRQVKAEAIPKYSNDWNLRVIVGPQNDYWDDMFLAEKYALGKFAWEVAPLFDRVGIRLIGPEQQWRPPDKRPPSGAHPSNMYSQPIGAGVINMCGDVPIILAADGVTHTSYVNPATIINADMWKLGQMKAGDKVRFKAVKQEEATQARRELEALITENSVTTV